MIQKTSPDKQDKCAHCGDIRYIQARGLCRTCYRRIDIRDQYKASYTRRPARNPQENRPMCKHCHNRTVPIRGRDLDRRPTYQYHGLCLICYVDKDIRALHPWTTPPRPQDVYGPDCRRCGEPRQGRCKKGLCGSCYYKHGDKYKSLVSNLDADFNGNLPLPKESTDTQPGSNEKIQVMAARAADGQHVFHPDDYQGT